MSNMHAYLDDFGKITVTVSRKFYNGKSDSFYITANKGYMSDLVITMIEEYLDEVKYHLSCPLTLQAATAYMVHDNHGLAVPLSKRMIVRTKKFNEIYEYDGDDLGASYHRWHTDFALWAPTAAAVTLRVRNDNKVRAYNMERGDKGVWRVSVIGDLKHATYTYLVDRNGVIAESLDPYALSSSGNGRESAVIDLSEIEKIEDYPLAQRISGVDAVIYEANVRDMTSHANTGTKAHGTFAALAEEGTTFRDMPTGLDYLASLGVTHVQLMPVMDYATVDEFHVNKNYNWGYDPAQYLTPEGSYSSDPDDPYARMKELREMVCMMHKKGMRVNLDVVFNHMYSDEGSPFDSSMPYYFFRYNASGHSSNGSFCGNDFSSEQPMARRYIVHCIKKLMEIYHVDGFRFDLMGILDVETMNQIVATARQINPDVMIYGEGWDLPTMLEPEKKANILNQGKMPGVGHFNDYFRDVLKGRTSDDQKYDRGYCTGDLAQAFGALSGLVANVLKEPYFWRFTEPDQSINGPETHDNGTVWDKMHFSNANEDRATRQKRQKMLIACTMVAQGVPFIHAGMEFCGTKNDNFNSFNAGDAINQMDWVRAEINEEIIDFTRKCIAMRRRCEGFRLKSAKEIGEKVRMYVDDSIVFYNISHEQGDMKQLKVIINPTFNAKYYSFQEDWRIIMDEEGRSHEMTGRQFTVPQLSVYVLAHEEHQNTETHEKQGESE